MRALVSLVSLVGLVGLALGSFGCSTPPRPRTATLESTIGDLRAMSCKQIAALAPKAVAALDDDTRQHVEYRTARCRVIAGDLSGARELAARWQGPRGRGFRAFIEVLAAADEDIESAAAKWVETGFADARAFVREPKLVKHAAAPWFTPLALAAWEADLRAHRSTALGPFVRELGGVRGLRVIENDAASGAPGDLVLLQGEIVKSQPRPADRALVLAMGIAAQWVTTGANIYTEGERVEPTLGGYKKGPDQIVRETESAETFTTTGPTFHADVPAFTLPWRRIVIVGELAAAPEGVDAPFVRSLMVLPRTSRVDISHTYEFNEF